MVVVEMYVIHGMSWKCLTMTSMVTAAATKAINQNYPGNSASSRSE